MIGKPRLTVGRFAVIASALVTVGTAIRLIGIKDHFGHIDDLVTIAGPYLINQGQPMTVVVPGTAGRVTLTVDAHRIKTNPLLYAAYVSATQTYAPLQFLFYPLLLSGEYSYREFLLRGRLPSAIAGCLSLLAFLFMYRRYRGQIDPAGLLGLTTLTFSLMGIVYAQQAMPYALGVLAYVGLLWIVVYFGRQGIGVRGLWFVAGACGVFAYANYQAAAMVPATYLALFATDVWRHQQSWAKSLGRYALSFLAFIALVLPLQVFLRDKSGSGHLLGTPGFEQYFFRPGAGSRAKLPFDLAAYLAKAAMTVGQTDLTFANDSALGQICVWLLLALAVVGCAGLLAARRKPVDFALAVFIAGACLTWLVLNILGRFPLSPTRHVLVLTPILGLLIAVGFNFARERVKAPSIASEWAAWALVATITVLFATHYRSFREERRDRFAEAALAKLLADNHLDTIVGYAATWNPALMFRNPEKEVTFIDLDAIVRKGSQSKVHLPAPPFLLASHKGEIEQYPELYAALRRENLQIRHLVDVGSNTEVHLDKTVKYGANGIFLSVAEK